MRRRAQPWKESSSWKASSSHSRGAQSQELEWTAVTVTWGSWNGEWWRWQDPDRWRLEIGPWEEDMHGVWWQWWEQEDGVGWLQWNGWLVRRGHTHQWYQWWSTKDWKGWLVGKVAPADSGLLQRCLQTLAASAGVKPAQPQPQPLQQLQ